MTDPIREAAETIAGGLYAAAGIEPWQPTEEQREELWRRAERGDANAWRIINHHGIAPPTAFRGGQGHDVDDVYDGGRALAWLGLLGVVVVGIFLAAMIAQVGR